MFFNAKLSTACSAVGCLLLLVHVLAASRTHFKPKKVQVMDRGQLRESRRDFEVNGQQELLEPLNQVGERSVADKGSLGGGTLRSMLVILGYCFVAIVVALAAFGLFTAFSKRKKKKKSNKGGEYGSDTEKSTTMSTICSRSKEKEKRRKHKEFKKKKKKDKHQRDHKMKRDDQSVFVPMPPDESSSDQKYHKKHRKDKKDIKEKRGKQKQLHKTKKHDQERHKDRRRAAKSESFLDEFTGQSENSETVPPRTNAARRRNCEKNYQKQRKPRSPSTTTTTDNSEFTLGPDGSSLSSKCAPSEMWTSESGSTASLFEKQKHTAAEKVVLCTDQSVPIAKQLRQLDRDAVIYVYKSSVAKIDKSGVHINPLDLHAVLPLDNRNAKPNVVNAFDQSVPATPTSVSSERSPYDTTVLYQSRIFQSLKTNSSPVSEQIPAANDDHDYRGSDVLGAIVHKKRPTTSKHVPSATEAKLPEGNVNEDMQDTSILFDLSRAKAPTYQARRQSGRTAKPTARRSPRLKSILRRSLSSRNHSASSQDLPSAQGRRPQSLKRVSFSHKMEVRYIK